MDSTTFDAQSASDRHYAIMRDLQWIRDGINTDLVDYYYDRVPQNEDEVKAERDGMRKYLEIAQDRIRELLNGKLY